MESILFYLRILLTLFNFCDKTNDRDVVLWSDFMPIKHDPLRYTATKDRPKIYVQWVISFSKFLWCLFPHRIRSFVSIWFFFEIFMCLKHFLQGLVCENINAIYFVNCFHLIYVLCNGFEKRKAFTFRRLIIQLQINAVQWNSNWKSWIFSVYIMHR